MIPHRLSTTIIIASLILAFCANFVRAADYSSPDDNAKILALTNELLLKEINLERYHLQYRVLGSREPKYRRLRYFLAQDASAGSFLAADIIGVSDAAVALNVPERASIAGQRASVISGMMGSILDGGSSAIELGSNALLAEKNRAEKHDPKTAAKTVKAMLVDIDGLTRQRDGLIAANSASPSSKLYEAESRILKALRDSSVYEFADAYSDIKSNQSSYNVYYALDIAGEAVYVGSYILSLAAFRRASLFGPGSICGIVGDGIFIPTAPLSALSGTVLYNRAYANISRFLNEKPYDAEPQAKADIDKLAALLDSTEPALIAQAGPISRRLSIYRTWSQRYDKYIDRKQVQIKHESQVARQSEITGPLIGGAFLGGDVMAAVSHYGQRHRQTHQSSLALASQLSYGAGSLTNLAFTSQWIYGETTFLRRSKKEHTLPEELLAERLKTLDELEASLNTSD